RERWTIYGDYASWDSPLQARAGSSLLESGGHYPAPSSLSSAHSTKNEALLEAVFSTHNCLRLTPSRATTTCIPGHWRMNAMDRPMLALVVFFLHPLLAWGQDPCWPQPALTFYYPAFFYPGCEPVVPLICYPAEAPPSMPTVSETAPPATQPGRQSTPVSP